MCGDGWSPDYGNCSYTSGQCDWSHAACADCADCLGNEGWGWYNYGCDYGCPVEGVQTAVTAAVSAGDAAKLVALITDKANRITLAPFATAVTTVDCAGRPAVYLTLDDRLRRELLSRLPDRRGSAED
jgi:hypothetical protein